MGKTFEINVFSVLALNSYRAVDIVHNTRKKAPHIQMCHLKKNAIDLPHLQCKKAI